MMKSQTLKVYVKQLTVSKFVASGLERLANAPTVASGGQLASAVYLRKGLTSDVANELQVA